ncbi:hypothetical protein BC832DRAFT_554845 [Gaertneriomyces semiglobifer]|nr:hypothetical protein BC832DRAFT_554845 [Gaertneriomyces semiglobifer]
MSFLCSLYKSMGLYSTLLYSASQSLYSLSTINYILLLLSTQHSQHTHFCPPPPPFCCVLCGKSTRVTAQVRICYLLGVSCACGGVMIDYTVCVAGSANEWQVGPWQNIG